MKRRRSHMDGPGRTEQAEPAAAGAARPKASGGSARQRRAAAAVQNGTVATATGLGRAHSRLRQGRSASSGCGTLTSRRGRAHPDAVRGLHDKCHPLVAQDVKSFADHGEGRVDRGSGSNQLSRHGLAQASSRDPRQGAGQPAEEAKPRAADGDCRGGEARASARETSAGSRGEVVGQGVRTGGKCRRDPSAEPLHPGPGAVRAKPRRLEGARSKEVMGPGKPRPAAPQEVHPAMAARARHLGRAPAPSARPQVPRSNRGREDHTTADQAALRLKRGDGVGAAAWGGQ